MVTQARRLWMLAGLALCAAAVACGWFLSEWLAVRPLRTQLGDRDRAIASLRDEVSSLRYRNEQLQRQTEPDAAAGPLTERAASPGTGAGPRQRPANPGVPVSFRGPVYNETMHQGGQMSLVIRRQGPPGSIAARFEAWGGLLGSGDLTGTLSEDGRISVSGQIMVRGNPFVCDLSGTVTGDKLAGSADFVRSAGGRTWHSSFTLTRS